jgi:hypothetical protein
LQHATCLLATCNVPPCNMQRASLQHATCHTHQARIEILSTERAQRALITPAGYAEC